MMKTTALKIMMSNIGPRNDPQNTIKLLMKQLIKEKQKQECEYCMCTLLHCTVATILSLAISTYTLLLVIMLLNHEFNPLTIQVLL